MSTKRRLPGLILVRAAGASGLRLAVHGEQWLSGPGDARPCWYAVGQGTPLCGASPTFVLSGTTGGRQPGEQPNVVGRRSRHPSLVGAGCIMGSRPTLTGAWPGSCYFDDVFHRLVRVRGRVLSEHLPLHHRAAGGRRPTPARP